MPNRIHGGSSPQRILVVDDDPSIRLVCVKSLTHAGYAVLEAAGSSEAMAIYGTAMEPIHLLLTDLFLPPPDFQLTSSKSRYPRVHGHELVRQARSLRKELRVLLMSSHSLASVVSLGLPVAQDRFLQKPFSVSALLESVAAALAGPPLPFDSPAVAPPTTDVQWVD
jgi:CheY-like chemotaxis protein